MAFPATYNFNYYRGDSAEFVARPKNANNGLSFDLTDYSAVFTIANQRGDGAVQYSDAEGMTAVVDEATNVVTCTISPTGGRLLDAGTYVYDVQIDNDVQIYTLLTGTITVTDDITGAS